MKNKTINQSIATALIAGFICAPFTSCSNMSDSTATQAQGTGLGALIGAGVGVGIGALVGDDNRGTAMAIGGGVGALIGGAIGYQWGKSVAIKKDQYSKTESYIRANINQLDDRIDEAESYNKKLNNQIASLNKSKKKISVEDYNKVKSTINAGVGQIDTALSSARTAKKYAGADEKKVLNAKIATLEAERKELISNRSALSRYKARA